jgi:ribosomal protein S18 acetylase RimI-like enzyme
MALEDRVVEASRGELVLTTDKSRVARATVLAMLRESHWGGAMTMPVLDRAIANSVTFSVLDRAGNQLGFARVVSDLATYAYLTDVIVAAAARGQGIGSWMVEAILAHPDLQGLRRVALYTRDARALYERYGFSTDRPASVYMELRPR